MTDWKIPDCARPLLLIMVSILMGCSITGQSPPTRFYVLTPVSDTGPDLQFSAENQYTVVSVDPVEFPDYLKRSRLVIRKSRNRYLLAEFDQWAVSLQSNFEQVLLKNLNGMIPGSSVAVVQWRRYLDIDYFLRVKVICLEGDMDGNVTLEVNWMLFEEEGEKLILARMSTYMEQSDPGDYEEMAAAQSRAIAAFSREVAGVLQHLPEQDSARRTPD